MKGTVEQKPKTAVAAPEDSTGGALASQEHTGTLSGEWGADGTLAIPQFKLIQPSDELAGEFGAGSFVFDKEERLAEKGDRVALTLLHAQLYWRENLTPEERDNGQLPRNFDSLDEAKSEGLRQGGYKDRGKGTVSAAAKALVLVEVPEALGLFEYDGKHYAKAVWYAHGVVYAIISRLVTTVQQSTEHRGKTYCLNAAVSSGDGRKPTYVQPILHRNGFHDDAFIDWIEKQVL